MEQKNRKPLNFGQTMLASALGVVIAGAVLSIVGFLLMIVLMVGMLSGLSGETTATPLKGNTFLKVDLTLPVAETGDDALSNLFNENTSLGADQLLSGIRAAKNDDKVCGLYLTVGGTSGLSWGLAEELRNALIDFKEAGKEVVFYGESYSQTEYYLASVASRVCLHTDGMIDLRGIGAQVMYYKDLFDKLGVKVDLIRPASCAYKSAGEPYIMNHMSDANREQMRHYLHSIWSHVAAEICQSRNLGDVKDFNHLVDNLQGCLSGDALKAQLVDTLCYAADVVAQLRKGCDHSVAITSYGPVINNNLMPEATGSDCIAVVYASGTVQAGSYPGIGGNIYTDRMVKAINDAANDDGVKAIVLRVNSPGGAATTSQSITNAIRMAREKKPVVVSMSDYAASAGYEMSCLANVIVAQPTTITGSIGVFGTIPEVGTMLKKKVGLTFDTVQTNANSAGLSLVAPLSPAARAMMQRNVEEFYQTFIGTVAEGRSLTTKYVDSIARGRVWSGADALSLGLVDTLGGLYDAIGIAAALAQTNNYSIVRYPKPLTATEQLMALWNSTDDDCDSYSLRTLFRLRQQARMPLEQRLRDDLLSLANAPALQARMPYLLILD